VKNLITLLKDPGAEFSPASLNFTITGGDANLKHSLLQKRDGSELKQCAIAQGMETLRHDGWRRVMQGITTIEEVVRVTQTDEVMAETTPEAEPVVAR